MKKVKVYEDYGIVFYDINKKFELIQFDEKPKKDKYTKTMIDSGSRGHELYRPPTYEYHYFTSSAERADWFKYLEEILVYVKEYCMQNELTLLKNVTFEKINTLIKENKVWDKEYTEKQFKLKQKELEKEARREKEIAVRYLNEVLRKEERQFVKNSLGFSEGEVMAYVNASGDILIKNLELSEYYNIGNIFKK